MQHILHICDCLVIPYGVATAHLLLVAAAHLLLMAVAYLLHVESN
jgi:hypothetical protein